MEKNYKEKMYRWIEKESYNERDKEIKLELYALIEEVCGRKADKIFRALLRRGIKSVTALVNLFTNFSNDEIFMMLYGSYIGPSGISVLSECVSYQTDRIPF